MCYILRFTHQTNTLALLFLYLRLNYLNNIVQETDIFSESCLLSEYVRMGADFNYR